MDTKELKKEILNNLSKNKQYVKSKFRIENNLTPKQCFDILYPEKIKKCRYCGKEAEFKSFSLGYKDICDSKECKHKHRIETVKKTNLEKYGVENVSQLESIKKKKIETVFKHYGVCDYLNSEQNKHNMYDENGVHKSKSKEANEKRKQTLLEKYGTTDRFKINNGHEKANSKEGREKAKQTLLKNHGVTSSWKLQKTKDTIKKTNLEKYGETSYSKTNEFKENLKNHNIEKYGTPWFVNTEEYKEKYKETCLKKYGVEFFTQSDVYLEKAKETYREKYDSDFYMSSEIRRQKEIESGRWLADEQKSDYERYSESVWRFTNRQDLETLENYDKRGRLDEDENAFHLDHKFSIKKGFEENIPPEIIGSLKNLEMIPGRKNCAKNSKCSITKEELLDDSN